MIPWESVKSLASKLEIDEFTILREYLQVLFLRYFYTSKESEKIYFKGGTLIHFLLGSFRFSEDLDFTSLLEAEKLESLLNTSVEKMRLEVPGLNLEPILTKEFSLSKRLKYKDERFKFPLTISLEFSLREVPLTRKVTPLETEYPVIPYPLIVHLDWEEILAEKVRDLLTRARGRDLFDLWFLLGKGVRLDWKMVDKKMEWYKKSARPTQLIEAIENFDEKELKKDLGKFLPRTHREIIKDLKKLTLKKIEEKDTI